MKLNKGTWERVKIGQVTSIIGGGTPSRSNPDFFKGDLLWIGPTEIPKDKIRVIQNTNEKITIEAIKKSNAKLLPPGTILFTTRATVGEVAIAGKEIATSQSLENFICNPRKINNWYLAYWLKGNQSLILSLSAGTTFKGITRNILSKIEIPLPPLEEQKQIASLFQSIETAVDQAEIQEKSLIILKKQLLRDLFSSNPKFGNYFTETDFEPVRFENLAFNISERVEPKETNLDTYVGLEHLDSDSLTIERTGIPEDVIGTKLKIYKSDIIFGKRRAYLRKVAVSHFDGIASAHSMVLRANEKNIDKDFLPHFMQSDTFMERAVQISEGSLSPTIKWKTLAIQEFVLPKKEKQSRLIEIFKQFDTTSNLLKKQISTLRTLKQNLLNEILG